MDNFLPIDGAFRLKYARIFQRGKAFWQGESFGFFFQRANFENYYTHRAEILHTDR